MQPGLAAFFVGFFLANAIPHMLVALYVLHFTNGRFFYLKWNSPGD